MRLLDNARSPYLNDEHNWWKVQAVTQTHKGHDKHTAKNNKVKTDRYHALLAANSWS